MLQDALQETETISLEQAESHLDVKQLQLVHKQLRLAGNLQNRQEYFLPMYLGDQLAGVHLTLQQGTGETSAGPSFFDCGSTFLYGYSYICNSGYIPPHYYCHMLPLLSCTAAIV